MKERFFAKIFIFFIVILGYFLNTPHSFAAYSLTDPIIKPLRLEEGSKTKLQNYDNNDIFNPAYINEKDTRVVDVYFVLDTNPKTSSTTEFLLCFKSRPDEECKKNNKSGNNLWPVNEGSTGLDPNGADSDVLGELNRRNNGGDVLKAENIIRVRVCGAGSSDLSAFGQCEKGTSDGKTDWTKVWFNGGKAHSITLYERDKGAGNQLNQIAQAQFYVNYYFPNVFIKVNGEKFSLVTKTDDNNLIKYKGISPDKDGVITFPETNMFPIKLEVKLSGRKPSGQIQNNYKVTLEGSIVKYKKSSCIEIINNKLEFSETQTNEGRMFRSDKPDVVFENLKTGDYFLTIHDQNKEDAIQHALKRSTSCSDGNTFWKIPINIARKKSAGKTNYVVTVADVQKDPNGDNITQETGALQANGKDVPCAPGEYIDGQCLKVPIALLGNISTDPVLFIKDIFGFILSIAGSIAIILLIISGYRIMTSMGDKQKLAGAQETITSAIIGLLFIIFSLVILQFIGVDLLRIPGFR